MGCVKLLARLDAFGTDDPDFREGHPEDRGPLCGHPVDEHPCWRHRVAALIPIFFGCPPTPLTRLPMAVRDLAMPERTLPVAQRYWPLGVGWVVTSPFGPRGRGFHAGVDFGRAGGSANMPVYAVQSGTVIYAGAAQGYGGPDPAGWLVIDSTDDSAKPLMALDPTIDDLRDHIFNWKTWPNFGSEGQRPLNKYAYQRMRPGQEQPIAGTSLTVEGYPLSHSDHYPSSAFLLRGKDQYLLYCGDTGPDEVENSPHRGNLWKRVAPLIREKKLRGLMLEVSYPDGRKPSELFGHLTPEWMMKELHRLAQEVDASNPGAALKGLKVVVTHIKPSLDAAPTPRQLIEQQLRQRNDLGVEWVFPEQGQRLDF